MDTIVALSTPAGNSGVAVVRISGDQAKSILNKLICQDMDFEPRKMYLKKVYFNDMWDQCLVVFFQSPMSYTGEDVAEVQSHGGYFVAQKIIEQAMAFGAKLAERGEFSKRAFINGKMTIDQAEGIMDIINAESEAQAKAGNNLFKGNLTKKINGYQSVLTDILAEIEAKLDYPEYEYTFEETSDIKAKLSQITHNLKNMIDDSQKGLMIKNGVRVAIAGAPNVGKSSLLNALTSSEKAIVTNIAGTTRDIVEAEYEYNGIIFRLFDTAGIHESKDVVEQIGINRAKDVINDADIVLLVSDNLGLCNVVTDKPFINVLNKSDIQTSIVNDFRLKQGTKIEVSALNNHNIQALKELIFNETLAKEIKPDQLYLNNTRHISCVQSALECLNNVMDLFEVTTMDIISNEIKSAWLSLGEISGITSDEKIIDQIFAKFCLGK